MESVSAKLVYYTPNYMEVIAGAMSKCYEKTVSEKGVLKAVEAGHLSVLEHAYATFDITCSLAVLGQFTRHRHLSPTVKSTRGAYFAVEYVIPPAISELSSLEYEYVEHMESTFRLYHTLIDAGIPKEDAAYVLPKATLTNFRVTGNFRAWFEYLPKRLCRRAMTEHRWLAKLIHAELRKHIIIYDRDFMACDVCTEEGCRFSKR